MHCLLAWEARPASRAAYNPLADLQRTLWASLRPPGASLQTERCLLQFELWDRMDLARRKQMPLTLPKYGLLQIIPPQRVHSQCDPEVRVWAGLTHLAEDTEQPLDPMPSWWEIRGGFSIVLVTYNPLSVLGKDLGAADPGGSWASP